MSLDKIQEDIIRVVKSSMYFGEKNTRLFYESEPEYKEIMDQVKRIMELIELEIVRR